MPDEYDYYGVEYPATINLQASRDVGLPIMDMAIIDRSTEQYLIVAGYSEGSLIAEMERRKLAGDGPEGRPVEHPTELPADRVTVRRQRRHLRPVTRVRHSRYHRRDGGRAADAIRHHSMPPANTTRTGTFRPTSTRSRSRIRFWPFAMVTRTPYYDPIDPGTSPAYVTTVHNTAQGSTDTYVLYYSAHLPLLGPVRELAGLVSLTPLTEPVLSAVEPLLRLVIDMGYTDRVNADPATPTPFSFITPPAKILEALAGLPGALTQGATNLLNGGHTATTPPDPHGTLVPAASLVPALRASPRHSEQPGTVGDRP